MANTGIIKKSNEVRVRKLYGKSGKMQHKQIMERNGTSFYIIGLKSSETANKVFNVSFPLFEKLSATYIAYRRKKQYILPG